MRAVLDIIMVVLNLYTWIVIAEAILSWLIAFGVVNIRNDEVVRAICGSVSRPGRSSSCARIRNFSAHCHRGRRYPRRSSSCSVSCCSSGSSSITSIRTYSKAAMTGAFAAKTAAGRFFEDFRLGETIRHATPRTLSDRRRLRLFGTLRRTLRAAKRGNVRSRHRLPRTANRRPARVPCRVRQNRARRLAQRGRQSRLRRLPLPKAGLSGRHAMGGFAGDRPQGELEQAEAGVVHVRSRGFNQRGESVIEYVRWVMVRKRDFGAEALPAQAPKLPETVAVVDLGAACPAHRSRRVRRRPKRFALSRFEDATLRARRIDHVDGVTVEEAEHQAATRLYQNTAKIAFQPVQRGAGSVRPTGSSTAFTSISLARARVSSSLANAFHITAINGGRHVAPLFAGDTVFAWSEVVETAALPGRDDVGALRLRTIATKNRPCADFPLREGEAYEPHVVLDLDYWALAPRQP